MLWRTITALFALVAITTVPTDAQCTKPRVRRSWTVLSSTERQLYKDAIASAMDSGAYIKFVEIHTEMMSEMEAHRQCMFVYWHRLLLVAFENMLRGQGSRYACVTVPYWDWMTDYNKFISGECNSILGCSPALGYLGGAPPRSTKAVAINGELSVGYCEADSPMNHFCESSRVSGRRCAKCVPRDNWGALSFPASVSYASVRSQIFGANNIGEMSTAIEEGAHNNVHAQLGSTMATFASPADPVFWSHHAMVDALHSIFHKCKVGEQKLTLQEKAASVDWTSCERRNGGIFNPFDYVTMRTGFLGQNPINATRDSLVGRFFNGVPLQFVALMDTRDLGSSSYSYELQGLMGTLYSTCGSTAPTSRVLESGGLSNTGVAQQTPLLTPCPASKGAAENAVISGMTANTTTPPSMGSLVNTTESEPSTKKVHGWLNSTDKQVKKRGGNAILEAEKMTCLFQDECLGGVTSYTPEFKKKFGITKEPRCKRIVDRIRRKADSVKIADWKTQMVQTFGCPQPKKTEAPPAVTAAPPVAPKSSASCSGSGSGDQGSVVASVGVL